MLDGCGPASLVAAKYGEIEREREREREMWLRPKGSLVLCMGFDVSFYLARDILFLIDCLFWSPSPTHKKCSN